MSKQMFVYILTNKINTVLYTGVTSNLKRRVYEHKEKIKSKFTARYNVNKLVYYEVFSDSYNAIRPGEADQSWLPSEEDRIDQCSESSMG